MLKSGKCVFKIIIYFQQIFPFFRVNLERLFTLKLRFLILAALQLIDSYQSHVRFLF